MKIFGALVGLSLLVSSFSCQNEPLTSEVPVSADCPTYSEWQVTGQLKEVAGTVVNERDTSKAGTGWIYITSADDQRYFACNLPASVQTSGTKVIFSADEFEPAPNVRLAGKPIRLIRLQRVQ